MPDLTVGIQVAGAQQAAGQLNSVGTAAANAGNKAGTAGKGFSNLGQRVAGVAAGISLMANSIFAIENSFDKVTQAQIKAETTTNRYNGAVLAADKALKRYNDAVAGGKTSQADLNRLHAEAVQAANKVGPAYDKMTLAVDDAKEAQTEFYVNLAPQLMQLGSGAAMMLAFGRNAAGMGKGMGEAATHGSHLGRNLGILGISLGVAAGIFLAIKNNVFGFRDALNSIGKAIGDAVPALRPLLELIKGLGAAIGLAPDVTNWKTAVGGALDTIKTQVGEFARVVKENVDKAIQWLGEFVSKVHGGDISGAFGMIKDAAVGAFNGIKTAILSVNWAQVWQGLQDAFNSSVSWLRTSAGSIGSSISTTIKNWNWGDAWGSLQDAFWSSVNFLNNLRLQVNAAVDWVLSHIWPALQTVWATLKSWWGPAKAAYNATIDWLVKNIWPALQTVWATLVQAWGQAQAVYNAAIDWAIKNVWPALTTVWSTLVQAWGPAKAAYNAVVNWALQYAWPALTDAVWSTLRQAWGPVSAAYHATIKFIGKYLWPSQAEVQANKATYAEVTAEVPLKVKFVMEAVVFPHIDFQSASVINAINAGLKGLPGIGTDIGNAIKNWVFSQFPGTTTVDVTGKSIAVSGLSVKGAGDMWGNFVQWIKDNMPTSVASAKALSVTFASIDWQGMRVAFERAARDMSAFFWNSISEEVRKASGGLLNLPKISWRVEIDATNISRDLQRLHQEMRTATPDRKIKIVAEISELMPKLATAVAEIKKIPPHLRTKVEADIVKFEQDMRNAQQNIDKIPKKTTTTTNVTTPNVQPVINAINQIPKTYTVTVLQQMSSSFLQGRYGGGVAGTAPTTYRAPTPYGLAEGFGPEVVKKPTLLMVAEQGPEMVYVGKPDSMRGMAGGSRGPPISMGGGNGNQDEFFRRLETNFERLLQRFVNQDRSTQTDLLVDGNRMSRVSTKYAGNNRYGDY